MNNFSFINELINTQSIDELWPLHCERMREFGFDRLIYGYTNFRNGENLGNRADFIVLSNHDPCYLDWFLGEKNYQRAPMVQWALRHEGAASWREISSMLDSKQLEDSAAAFVEKNAEFGVHAGYTVSFKSVTPRAKGAIALTAGESISQAEVDSIWRSHGEEITALNNIVHLKILDLPMRPLARHLTKRQREVLRWIGEGKTTADAAVILGVTAATVEKHLRLARHALEADTTAQAILKSALLNQFYIFDSEKEQNVSP